MSGAFEGEDENKERFGDRGKPSQNPVQLRRSGFLFRLSTWSYMHQGLVQISLIVVSLKIQF